MRRGVQAALRALLPLLLRAVAVFLEEQLRAGGQQQRSPQAAADGCSQPRRSSSFPGALRALGAGAGAPPWCPSGREEEGRRTGESEEDSDRHGGLREHDLHVLVSHAVSDALQASSSLSNMSLCGSVGVRSCGGGGSPGGSTSGSACGGSPRAAAGEEAAASPRRRPLRVAAMARGDVGAAVATREDDGGLAKPEGL